MTLTPEGREPFVKLESVGKTYYPSPTWMKLLVRTNITKEVAALSDVSFEVPGGEVCVIVGPNGAGKTTSFRVLNGLTTPTTGRATVMGFDATHDGMDVRRLIGWMPAEDRSLLMRVSCAENLRFHGRLHGLAGHELDGLVADALAKVGLSQAANNSVFSLSAGMRARLQLARALLHSPGVLILDEPTGSVDPVAAHSLLELVTGLVKEEGMAALISSHRLEEIEALHSHVVLLDAGRVRFDGDLDDLRKQLDRRTVHIRFENPAAAKQARELLESSQLPTSIASVDGGLECSLQSGVNAGQILRPLENLLEHIEDFTENRTPLRDILADVYRSDDA